MSDRHPDDPRDDEIIFASEEDTVVPPESGEPWKILVVDDEEDVHATTRLVLDDFRFEGRGLSFLNAYSGEQALEILRRDQDIAVILLDVVMESPTAGLEVARAVRQDLANPFVRIVLRTGQPGQAPERSVIVEYDLNDYKHKAELTAQRLFTTVYTALRSWRDLKVIDANRQGLRNILNATGDLFRVRSMSQLAQGVLTQVMSMVGFQDSAYFRETNGFALEEREEGDLRLVAATGRYEPCVGRSRRECKALSEGVLAKLDAARAMGRGLFIDGDYAGYFPTRHDRAHFLYIENCGDGSQSSVREGLGETAEELLQIFSNNVGTAFDNFHLNNEILETQKEIVHRLGEVVESRSKETANHVVRVATMSRVIASALGLEEELCERILLASPLHDVGKIAIPDAILLKPGPLDGEEMEIMRMHTTLGYNILAGSSRALLAMAAEIALDHHENWDGSGYPSGKSGEEITLSGRIVGVADVYDALIHARVYKQGWDESRAVEYILSQRGHKFDPAVVDAFRESFPEIRVVQARFPDDSAKDA